MKPKGSLPSSQEPTTGPYPKPANLVHTSPSYLPKFHSNIILPSTPRSSKCSLLFSFTEKKILDVF